MILKKKKVICKGDNGCLMAMVRIAELVQSGLSYEEAVHTAERESKLESNDVVQ